MPRTKNKKANIELLTLGELLSSLNIRQVFAVMSVIVITITTAYGYGYTSAQSRASSEMTLHVIGDERQEIENAKIHNLKDLMIEKLKAENETLRIATQNLQAPPPPKQVKFIVKVPKQHEK